MINFIKTISFSAVIALVLALSACNTVAGAGQDMQQGGQAIQNAASSAQH